MRSPCFRYLSCVLAIGAAGCLAAGGKSGNFSIEKLASVHGFPAPVVTGKIVTLQNKAVTLVFEADSRKLLFNRQLVWMNEPLTGTNGNYALRERDVDGVVCPLLRPGNVLASEKSQVVVLDPGHGGKDHGATGPGKMKEMDIALDLALRVRQKLAGSQAAVRLTRTSDRELALGERVRQINNLKPDIFVSIHLNMGATQTASGFETFVITSAGAGNTATREADAKSYIGNAHENASLLLGYFVQRGVVSSTKGGDRGVKRARYQVLRDVDCPSVLVECGFLSNPEDAGKLGDPQYREKVADGIALGICTYISRAQSARSSAAAKP